MGYYVSVDAPPLGPPPGVERFVARWPWTRRWPVKAGSPVSLSRARKSAGEAPDFFTFPLQSLYF